MKDFWVVLKERRSVRTFKDDDVPQALIEKILKAASIAPSGSNQKNWEFIILRDKQLKEKLGDIVLDRIHEVTARMRSVKAKTEFTSYSKYFTFFTAAPLVIAVVVKPYDSLTARILKKYFEEGSYESYAGMQSVSAAIENLLLACTALDLGACWMTGPLIAKKRLEETLKIETPDQLAAIIPVGFPKQKPKANAFPASVKNFTRFI